MPRRKGPGRAKEPVERSKNTSERIREACADALEASVPGLVAIARGEIEKATPATQVAAFDKLGKYGVGTRVTVEIVGEELAGVFARVLQETLELPPDRLDRFMDRLKEELLKLEQGEAEEPPENESYD